MLQSFRNFGRGWVGKIVVAILFFLLIVSFAIWGINDVFRGTPGNTVAKVGGSEVSTETLRTAYNNELQRLSRQIRQNITPEQARLFGIDQRVLGQLVTEATLDEKARELGLAVSDTLVARSITEDRTFRGSNGAFDRRLFDQLLRDNNLSEAAFVQDQRQTIRRLHLADAIAGSLPVPLAAREALHRYGAERRAADYILLPTDSAGEIPQPTEEQIAGFYSERKSSFQAPEYRGINLLVLDADTIAKPDEVSDADARKRYEEIKESRFGTPERRTLQQITFPSLADAQAAADRIRQGSATFETVATERGLSPNELEIGTFTKSEVADPAVADAAFGLEQGAVSAPIGGRFGPVLVRASQITPGQVKPFEEVADEVRREIALARSRERIETIHDTIEDQRASARPLAEIAPEQNLRLNTIEAVDRSGRDPAGKAVADVPEQETVIRAAFESDIGVDNAPIRLKNGGYAWFDVTRIDPAREKQIEEVRDEVVRLWRDDEIARRLNEKSQTLVERLGRGETLAAMASELSLQVQQARDLARGSGQDALDRDAVARIFSVPVGKPGTVGVEGGGRAVFQVTAATVPPFVTTTQQAQQIEERLQTGMSETLLNQYIAQAQKEIGISIDQQAVQRVVGGGL